MPRWPPRNDDAIIAAYLAGASVAELVQQVGRSRSTVYTRLRQSQVPLRVHARVRNGAASPTDVAAISGAYQAGATMAAVATQFGLSYSQVARALRVTGDTQRPRKSRRTDRAHTPTAGDG